MNCGKARLYSLDASDELGPGARRAVEQHLERCPACRETAGRLRAVGRLIALKRHEQPEPEVMDGFLDRFHQRLRMERTIRVRVPSRGWNWLWAEPAVVLRTSFASLLLVVAGLRILAVGLGAGGARDMAQDPRPFEILSASQAWFESSGDSRAEGGPGTIIIIRPKTARHAVPRRHIYERGSVLPASYEF